MQTPMELYRRLLWEHGTSLLDLFSPSPFVFIQTLLYSTFTFDGERDKDLEGQLGQCGLVRIYTSSSVGVGTALSFVSLFLSWL